MSRLDFEAEAFRKGTTPSFVFYIVSLAICIKTSRREDWDTEQCKGSQLLSILILTRSLFWSTLADGKVVVKFCRYLHQLVLENEAYSAGDLGPSVQKAFFRMDEMMCVQRGWRELAVLGDKFNKFTSMIEGLIWFPRGEANDHVDGWAFEEAYNLSRDHKAELEVEKERILKAGGFIHAGCVNGSLNLARAIGDMEFKQKVFACRKVDYNCQPRYKHSHFHSFKSIACVKSDILEFLQTVCVTLKMDDTVDLCDDDDFLLLACDGIWKARSQQYVKECLKGGWFHQRGVVGCDNMTIILVQYKKTSESNLPVKEQTSTFEPDSQPEESESK
ncbi:hypothetical protein IFM89_034177 [Coptis chinensis]|uniref:PPM-type phosphatase domain-containing protein n=1 Tax=Coptis chinensis TaxID=261450 RepID=A0A835IIM2_9MAGN|nr:hypothetical protein IFM89_034177 [Coptis chinensis]